jgi:hypothetical protein
MLSKSPIMASAVSKRAKLREATRGAPESETTVVYCLSWSREEPGLPRAA